MPITTMKYYYTGVQHLLDGTEVGIPLVAYDNVDAYLAKYHQEMSYALAADNMAGLTTIVFDSTGVIVLQDHWMREIEQTSEEQTE